MPNNRDKPEPSPQVFVAPIFSISGKAVKPEITIQKNAAQQTFFQAEYTNLGLTSGSLTQKTAFEPKEVADALKALATVLEQITIDTISVSHYAALNESQFTCELEISGVPLGLTIQQIRGETQFKLTLDTLELDPKVLKNGFIAAFETETSISIGEIFGKGIDNLPDSVKDLRISPKSGVLVYSKSKPEVPKTEDSSVTRKLIFGMELGLAFPALTELPLVGDKLPSDKTLAIDHLRFLIVSADFTATELQDILNESSHDAVITKYLGQVQTLSRGGSLSTALRFGEESHALNFSMAGTTSPKPTPKSTSPKTSDNPSISQSSTPKPASGNSADSSSTPPLPNLGPTVWLNIQKKIGPVSFNRVGVRYYDKLVWLLLDMALSLSDLTLSLSGLAVGFDVIAAFQNPKALLKPRFRLDGVGLQYTGKGPLQIGGAFLREQITLANGQTVDQYSGAALIRTEAFSLTAIGAYTEINGSPSLFIYAFLDHSLGGPPFFFVTGLALGFGYNRSLRLPTAIEQVASFPLVRLAIDGTPPIPHQSNTPSAQGSDSPASTKLSNQDRGKLMDVLGQLQSYIPPDPGKIFLAVGVKFTSFKLIDSFALLIASFGDEFRLKLLGISKIVAPASETGATPIAEVSIGLIAEFIPRQGVLKVDGKILPGAYIFSRDCQISGGFAFYSWFSGPHAGDFVLTVGGYHPRFNVPAHYPQVDRFRLNWRIDDSLSVKGSAYFALTSSAVMAGTTLEAYLNQGKLQAWFNFNADFLVAWQPFYYEAEISVNIRVSYQTFIKTFAFSVGVYLKIWGPEFQGIARVDLKIVQFNVSFGKKGNAKPNPLTWKEFKTAFLPAADPDNQQICTLSAKDGLTRTLRTNETTERWIINPKDLVLQIDTVIPCTQQTLTKDVIKKPSTPLGIGSMAVADLNSSLSLEVTCSGQPCQNAFVFIPIYKAVPSALWGTKIQPDLNDRPIQDALCGFEIRLAKQPDPGDTNDIKCSALKYNDDEFQSPFSWQATTKSAIDRNRSAKTILRQPDQPILEKLNKWMMLEDSDPSDQDLSESLIDEFIETPQVITV